MKKRVLYIDLPFIDEMGGDKNRSRFLWKYLSEQFNGDLLLLSGLTAKELGDNYKGGINLFTIPYKRGHGVQPDAIYSFQKKALRNLVSVLQKEQYDFIFSRFLSPYILVEKIAHHLSDARVIFDVDMLFSRIAELAWSKKKTLRNRYYFIENLKLKNFEKRVFKQPYTFLFTNPKERDLVIERYMPPEPDNLKIVPNAMQSTPLREKNTQKKYILFFGALNSQANSDAFSMLCNDIYPVIEKEIEEQNIFIRVVGRNMPRIFREISKNCRKIELVGEVEDISIEIRDALCALLPLRVASGTRTRILEAASQKCPVVSTTIGVEGLMLSPDAVIVQDSAEEIGNEVLSVISDSNRREQLGETLYKEAYAAYSEKAVGKFLVEQIMG